LNQPVGNSSINVNCPKAGFHASMPTWEC
jgi:hypothetical protein